MTNGSGSPALLSTTVLRPAMVIGGALLLLAVPLGGYLASSRCAITAMSHTAFTYQLEAEDDPDCYYGSAFNGGPVVMATDGSDREPIVLSQSYEWQDGCTWEAREVLTPHGARLYGYEYSEQVVACEQGAVPARACTRHGVVTVTPTE
jgi:hypothetical protein